MILIKILSRFLTVIFNWCRGSKPQHLKVYFFTKTFCLCSYSTFLFFLYANYSIYPRYHDCINISISFISIADISSCLKFTYTLQYSFISRLWKYCLKNFDSHLTLCACPSEWLVNNNHKSIDLTDKNVVPFHRRISSHDLPIVSKK